MAKNDTRRMQADDIGEAIGLLTRLPVSASGARGASTAWAWPLAGVAVGMIAGLIGWFAMAIGVPAPLAAGLTLVALIGLTGAMHEDGLADCADGFWGAWEKERRLEIMKDSMVGTYGILAIVISLLFRWFALAMLFEQGWVFGSVVAAATLSRVPMVGLMCWLEPARQGGLSASVGRPDNDTVTLAGVVGLAAALLFSGFAALPAALVAAMLAFIVSRVAIAKIDGQTGDVLGASQQITEIGVLILFATLAL